MTGRILLVDDDKPVREALAQTLELAEFAPTVCGSFIEAKDHISRHFQGVILSDIRMPGRDGFHLLDYAQEVDAELPVVLLTGEGDIPMAVRAMGAGAFDFLEKPCGPEDLVAVLARALQTRALIMENRRLRAELETGDPAARMLFGSSELAEQLRVRTRTAARSGTEVMVTGAPGTGISKVAEVLHLCSPRAKGAFVKRASAGMTRDSLSDALHEARNGSLFLDDVARMPSDTQLAVLDHLEAGGGARIIAGLVAAEDRDRDALNSDLFFRLSVVQVRIPSLSERPEDIPIIFQHYVAQAAEQAGIAVPEVSHDHMASLMAQSWPGNARSLMSAAMRFVLGMPEELGKSAGLGLAEQMAQVERSLLIAALGRNNGRATATAEALKLPRKTFYDKLARYGIRPEDYRR